MQIKAADDKQPDLDALAALLERPDVDAPMRRRIEQEIRQIRAGAAGEHDAAWQIEFHYGASRNYVTIHDLRLEVGDRVAQVDHLVLTRLLDVWVLESKHFADGVATNDHGEWSALYGRSERGMPSPVEQNRRHVMVLDDLFSKGVVHLPKRLGLVTIRPRIRSLILVSDNARIVRPRSRAAAAQVDGLDTVIKSERLRAVIDKDFDQRSSASILKSSARRRSKRWGATSRHSIGRSRSTGPPGSGCLQSPRQRRLWLRPPSNPRSPSRRGSAPSAGGPSRRASSTSARRIRDASAAGHSASPASAGRVDGPRGR